MSKSVQDAQKLGVQVHTRDRELASDLFGSDLKAGAVVEVPGGAVCLYDGAITKRGAWPGAPEIIQFTITFATGAASSLLASWLYDKLKGRVTELRIKRKSVEISPEGIRRAVEETIEVNKH